MLNKKSRTDQFSLIIHGHDGEGNDKRHFLEKEGAQVCGTHRCVPLAFSDSYAAQIVAAICVPSKNLHSRITMWHVTWQQRGVGLVSGTASKLFSTIAACHAAF